MCSFCDCLPSLCSPVPPPSEFLPSQSVALPHCSPFPLWCSFCTRCDQQMPQHVLPTPPDRTAMHISFTSAAGRKHPTTGRLRYMKLPLEFTLPSYNLLLRDVRAGARDRNCVGTLLVGFLIGVVLDLLDSAIL